VDPEKLVLTRFAELEGTTYAGIIEHEGKLIVSCAKNDVQEILLAEIEIPAK
jgi:hypothetical protein